MINESQADALLRKYNLPESRIRHSYGVAGIAFSIASLIHSRHPSLPINPFKVKIAALLHDIGRAQDGDHEINSMTILHNEGFHEIASIVCHGTIYEAMLLRGINNPLLLPISLENKIVAYSDARFKDSKIDMLERWDEITIRRQHESEKIRALNLAKERYFELERELQVLSGSTILIPD